MRNTPLTSINTVKQDIEKRVKNVIAHQLGINSKQIANDASFIDDLSADSLDSVELIMAFEEEFGLAISEEEADRIKKVSDIIDFVFIRLKSEQ